MDMNGIPDIWKTVNNSSSTLLFNELDWNSYRDVYPYRGDEDYEYIIEQVGKTKYGGEELPGFEPPGFVRAAYVAHGISIVGVVFSFIALIAMAVEQVILGFDMITAPFVGSIPLLAGVFAVYVSTVLAMMGFKKFKNIIQDPYVREYKDWLDKVQCDNDAYLPSHLHRVVRGEKSEVDFVPRSAPVEIREKVYPWERFWFYTWELLSVFSVMVLIFNIQSKVKKDMG